MKPLVLHMRACKFFGGPEKIICGHIKASLNFEHRVLGFSENGRESELVEHCRKNEIPGETLFPKGEFILAIFFQLRRILRNLRPSIVCSHGYKPTIVSLLAMKGLNLPLVVFSHGHTGENVKVSFFETLETWGMRFADAVIAVSKGHAEYLVKRGLRLRSVHVVQNASNCEAMKAPLANADRKRAELGFGEKEFLIIGAGRFSREKAFGDLIEAFALIHENFPEAHLLLAGDGPLGINLRKRVEEKRLSHVHFLGFRHDLDEIMCASDLFVLSSHTEGLPVVLLEALSAKKPVVATAVGGVPEVVEGDVSGYLVAPGRPDAFAVALGKMLSDPEKMEAMGRAGYERVRRDFTFEAQTEKLEAIYNQVLNRQKAGPDHRVPKS